MSPSVRLKHALVGGISALAVSYGAAGAWAQTVDSGASEEVVVTAQKREQRVNSVPMSIKAITGAALTERNITTAADLVKLVPGFTYQEMATGAPVYNLRGVGYVDETISASPAVTVYVDEVPLPFSSMARGVGLDLERVEVLKGPQGTLFGSNSTGGAFSYIAAKPTDELAAGVDASYGRFNTVDLQGYVSGPLSETARARIAVRSIRGDDWQKSYTRNDTLGRTEKYSGRAIFEWDASEKLRFTFNANGWIDQSDTQAPQLLKMTPQSPAAIYPDLLNYPLPPANARAADWTPGLDYGRDDKFYQVSLRADYDITENLTLTSISAYSDFKTRALYENGATAFIDTDRLATGAADSFYQEVRLSGDNDALKWIVGVNYDKSSAKEANFYRNEDSSNSEPFPGLRFNLARISTDQDIENVAAFANADYKFSDQWSLTLGARYTKSNRSAVNCSADAGNGNLAETLRLLKAIFKGVPSDQVAPIAIGECYVLDDNFDNGPVYNKLDEDNVSWRAVLNWEPAPNKLVYVNISKGYKSGTIASLAAITTSQYLPIKQEALLSYEAGVKLGFPDSRLQLNAAVFYYDYDDKQLLGKVQNPVFGVIGQLVNIPKSHLEGAEVELTWQPIDGLRLSAAGTYLHSEIEEYFGFSQTGVLADFKGSDLPFTPTWQLSAGIEYETPINADLGLILGLDYSYHSKTTSGIRDDLLDIPSYNLLDLRAGVESADGKWRVMVWGQNVTNEYYWTSAFRVQDSTIKYAARPATYGLSVSWRY